MPPDTLDAHFERDWRYDEQYTGKRILFDNEVRKGLSTDEPK
jgi:hypothetical protein